MSLQKSPILTPFHFILRRTDGCVFSAVGETSRRARHGSEVANLEGENIEKRALVGGNRTQIDGKLTWLASAFQLGLWRLHAVNRSGGESTREIEGFTTQTPTPTPPKF
jgi:hypothetical protein